MARQDIVFGGLDAVYISETGTRQEIVAGGVYIAETIAANSPFTAANLSNPQQPKDVSVNRGFISGIPTPLIGKDIFFGGAGQPPSAKDWPNPPGPQWPITNRTHIVSLNIGLLIASADPFRAPEWPNPQAPGFAVANRGFTAPLNLQLIGQDVFFGAPGQPPPNLDWPNPRGQAPGPIANRGFVAPLNVGLYFALPSPFVAPPWPNPQRPQFPLANLGFVESRQIFLRSPSSDQAGYHPALVVVAPAISGLPPAFGAWALRLVDVVNNTLQGKLNVTLSLTLAAGADTTTLIDARIGASSALLLAPLTATAAAEQAAGTLYVSAQKNGEATVSHANNGLMDRSFRVVILA